MFAGCHNILDIDQSSESLVSSSRRILSFIRESSTQTKEKIENQTIMKSA